VKTNKTKAIVREVGTAVAGWRETAAAPDFNGKGIERMETAFEHDELRKAISKSA